MKTIAIIPAAGKGIRSGNATPKQFVKFYGKELIAYTLQVFQRNKLIDEIAVAVSNDYLFDIEKIKKKYKLSKLKYIIEGGKERQDSVYSALKLIKARNNDLIAVHDAARPLLPEAILTNAVKIAGKKGNALVALNAKDTLIKNEGEKIFYLNRDEIYYVQTPQIFWYKDLMKAMDSAYNSGFYGTDESMLINRLGIKINIVEGSFLNFKVTTKEDLDIFKRLAKKL